MAYVHGEIARRIESADGRQRVDILARHDGFYQFYVHRLDTEESAWVHAHMSGLYQTYAECEADALLMPEGRGGPLGEG